MMVTEIIEFGVIRIAYDTYMYGDRHFAWQPTSIDPKITDILMRLELRLVGPIII